mmetsp:Transcript_87831/g.155738  ORF Transcript_87831/g.155738 Transcript_87831/m.155738 type:complete len:81 (+) Transcript_87831:144-386(+)
MLMCWKAGICQGVARDHKLEDQSYSSTVCWALRIQGTVAWKLQQSNGTEQHFSMPFSPGVEPPGRQFERAVLQSIGDSAR